MTDDTVNVLEQLTVQGWRGVVQMVTTQRHPYQSGPWNRGHSACVTTHMAALEFPRETGLILRCAGKAGNPFQTTHGNRLSCRVPEGRRVSDEAVPGPSVFPSREPGVSGNFWGHMKAVRSRFALQGGTGDFP